MTAHVHAELLPCPFCGETAMVKKNKTVMVSCTGCTAATFQRLADPSSAVTAWNTRANLEPLAATHFKIGDRVRILRAAESGENGWDESWEDGMDAAVGGYGVIEREEDSRGLAVRLENDEMSWTTWNFPAFVLELAEPHP